MFGVIFHWGLYSVPAYDYVVSARRRKTQNGSEWYLKRLLENGNYRPIAGWKETQEYHSQNYNNVDYYNFENSFAIMNPESKGIKIINWNPDNWMTLCKEIGASYVILTAKHHDGFCLWNTKTTDHNSYKSICHKDILLEFANSARRRGLRFGIYYSWLEFNKSCTIKYFDEVVIPQINELMLYNPDIWWFDGDWECNSKYTNDKMIEICKLLKQRNPRVEINDRIGGKDNKKDINFLGESTYRVYSDREIPIVVPRVPWEHINTIGLSWGYNKQQESKDYKSLEQLFDLYKRVTVMGGRFLLNLGPKADGSLDENEVTRLRELGSLIRR